MSERTITLNKADTDKWLKVFGKVAKYEIRYHGNGKYHLEAEQQVESRAVKRVWLSRRDSHDAATRAASLIERLYA